MEQRTKEPYDITIEIENNQCKILRMLRNLGIDHFKVIDIRGVAGGITSHLVQMPVHQINKIPGGSFRLEKRTKTREEISGWIDSTGCEVCSTILSHDSFLITGRSVEHDVITYSFITHDYESFQSTISKLENLGLKVNILGVRKYQPKKEPLTGTQERILWFALKLGFFAFPRKINTIELSKQLKIRPSTLSEISRRGIRRLLEHHFET